MRAHPERTGNAVGWLARVIDPRAGSFSLRRDTAPLPKSTSSGPPSEP